MENKIATDELGIIAVLVRDRDWSQTALGDRSTWSSELQAAVQILMGELDRTDTDPGTMPDVFSPVVCEEDRRYDALLDSIDRGFSVCEMIFDADGKAVDYRFLKINPAFAEVTGLKNAEGRTARELVPDLEEFWFQTYGNVVATGQSIRFENQAVELARWFDVNAFPIASSQSKNRFGILFADISDRCRREINAQFLSEIQNDLAFLSDPTEIMNAVGEKIRRFFGFSLLTFSQVDDKANTAHGFYDSRDVDIPTTVTTHNISDYFGDVHIERMKTGQIIAIDDVTTDPDLKDGGAAYSTYQVYSVINVPYLSKGEWKFWMTGSRRNRSSWRADELELMNVLSNAIYPRIERARAEIALQEKVLELQALLDIMPVGIAIAEDPNWEVVRVNSFAQEVLSVAPNILAMGDRAATLPFRMYRNGRELDGSESPLQLASKGVPIKDLEIQIVHADGTSQDWLVNATPLLDRFGQVRGSVAAISDVTKLRQIEADLRQIEEFKNRILESSPDCIKLLDSDGQILYINDGSISSLEIDDFSEYLHGQWLDFWQDEHRTKAEAALIKARAGEIAQFCGYSPTTKGELKWWEVIISPILNADNQIQQLLVNSRDISDRRRKEINSNFLTEIQKDLMVLEDADLIMNVVGEKIRSFFGFSLLTFNDIDVATDTAINFYNNRDADILDIVGSHHISSYFSDAHTEKIKTGEIVAIADVTVDPDIKDGGAAYLPYQIYSTVNVPYLSKNECKFVLSGNRREPSDWRADELELMRELTARLYLSLSRARAEADLRQNEEFKNRMLQSSPDCIKLVGLDGQILYMNEGGISLLEIDDFSKYLHRQWLDFWQDEHRTRAEAALIKARAGEVAQFYGYSPTAKGTPKWWEVIISPLRYADDRIQQLLISSRDISDRHLQERNANFLGEVQKDLLALSDVNQIMSVVGEKIRAFFGFSILVFADTDIEADFSRTVFNVRDADIPDAVSDHRLSDYWGTTHLDLLKAGQTVVISDVNTDPDIKDGGAAYAYYQIRSVICSPYLRVGKLKFILGGCRRQPSNWRTDELELLGELTARLYLCIERARAEALLQQSNQRFELTMQAINGFVYEWHLATNHIYRSEGLFKLIGIHAADALPTKEWWMEQIHPEDRERLGEIFAPLPPDCDRLQHEYRVLHADGRWIDVWDRSLLERNSAGEIISMIGSTSDISDRKQRERDNTFLIEIQNDIGFATDIHQMLDVVTEKITAWFGLSMIAIANVDVTANTCTTFYSRSNDGRFPQVAEYNLSDFFNEDRLHQLRLGETVKINDTCDDPQLHANFESVGVCSSLNLPYVSDGVWKFITGVTRSETSIWREDEIRLLNELIPRIYLEIERVHAEATLQHSNQRFELAMQAIDGVLYEWHLTTNHIYRSEGLFRLIGIHPADALPTKEWWMDRINPEDREHLREIFTALPPDCNRLQQEYRVLHADGRWIDVWDRSLLERNSAGEIISIIGSTSNVSDRKRTEQKLRESEERLRLTIEGTQVGTWDQDIQNNNRLFWSDRMFQLFGYEPHPTGEASEETWGKCLHPDDAEWVVRQWQQSLERGVRIRIEFRIIRANDRATRWVEAIGSFKCDSEGRAIRTTGVIFDISDRKFTETALVQSEERYRNLVELIPQLVWIATPEGSLLDVNQRWLDFTGLTLARAKSEGWETIIHAEDIPMLTKHWELAQEEGKYQAKSRMLNADGQYVWHLHQAIPIKDDRGEIIKWFGTATDIDEIAKLEAQSADLLSQIQERNQELDSFSYIVSHDLKAPLRAISNLSQWIEEDISDLIPSENQEQLQLMRSRVFRMEALIDGLLNYARVAREDISTEPVSIAELLAEILDSLDPPASFTVEIVPPLPTFTTKRILLIQVLANLIGNGIKHHGRTDGTINISVVEEAEFYRFNITDNGKGIDPQQQSRIFDIFQTQSSDKQSTGIGLALVKKIVETEGGEIQLTSEVGKGSTFSFTWRR